MNETKDPLLLDHEADGIRELDNKLPRWWVWLFYLTIAFAVCYFSYYHVLRAGDLSARRYEKQMVEHNKIKNASLAKFEASMAGMQPSEDPTVVASGEVVFANLCAPCHRQDLGGLVGPNLTDEYWIHGSGFVDNLKVIWDGVPEKGMVTWKGVLNPEQIHAVASYIYSKRGSNPANPKPPENAGAAAPAENVYE